MEDAGDGFPYRERQAAPTARTLSPSRIIGGHTVPCTWASVAMATARTAEAIPMVSWVNADSSDSSAGSACSTRKADLATLTASLARVASRMKIAWTNGDPTSPDRSTVTAPAAARVLHSVPPIEHPAIPARL